MRLIDKVLIAIDDDSSAAVALAAGCDLAARHGAKLLVHGVIQDLDRITATLEDIVPRTELRRRVIADRAATLERLARQHTGSRVDAPVEITAGLPFIEVIRKAITESASIIVQCSRRDTPGRLSSGDWHLIRKSPVPVWIVPAAGYVVPRKLLVAIDVADAEEHRDFNRSLLEHAAELAAAWGAHLTVLSAWQLPGERMLADSPFARVPPERLQLLLDELAYSARAAQGELRSWLEQRALLPVEMTAWHLEKGRARDIIPEFVRGHEIDLVVMGTLGRTGIPALLIGNTAEHVLSRIDCAIVTLKPSAFLTPVR